MNHAEHASALPPTDPAKLPHSFAVAFNSGDPDLLDGMYDADGVFVTPTGEAQVGHARRQANAAFQGLGVPIVVRPRETYVSGDTALLIVDWMIEGTAASGDNISIAGTATDVARRGPDERWRYVIDNPFGIEPRSA